MVISRYNSLQIINILQANCRAALEAVQPGELLQDEGEADTELQL